MIKIEEIFDGAIELTGYAIEFTCRNYILMVAFFIYKFEEYNKLKQILCES